MKFNKKITVLRKKKGWSQEDFASRLNVSRQSVFKWEAGENTPDIEKIKKIAKLFNVSLDLLLDDEKNIEEVETKKEIQPTISKPKPKYRKVFDSSISILTKEHSDIDHGYVEGLKHIQSEFFKMQEKGHKDSIAKKYYSKIIRVQHDCLLDFFIDERNSTIGFFFDGAEQFVCPFENFINASISNSGLHTGFTNTPVIGVGVGNKRSSLAVGSMPFGQTRLPGMYYFTISYFDEFGRIKEYAIKFSCLRTYQFYNGMVGSTGANYAFQDALSASTNKMLTSIVSSLEGVKVIGKKIINNEVEVKPLNYTENRTEVEKGKKQRDTLKKELRDLGWKEKQSRRRIGLIVFIALALAATGGIVACSINKAKQSDKTAQISRAQYVIGLINDLGEISLDSKEWLDKIENAYNSLTPSEKACVTNYDVYLQAKKKYMEILTESTKDDPTREITLSDLNGTWESKAYVWTIGTVDKAQAVLLSVYNKTTSSGGMGGVIPSNKLNSSVRVGYNVLTQRMEFRLFYYYQIGSEYLDVTAKDDGNGSITLYYQDETFTKK